MNEQIIKAIADSVAETLLAERGRIDARLSSLNEQIEVAKSALSAAIAALPVQIFVDQAAAIAEMSAAADKAYSEIAKSAAEDLKNIGELIDANAKAASEYNAEFAATIQSKLEANKSDVDEKTARLSSAVIELGNITKTLPSKSALEATAAELRVSLEAYSKESATEAAKIAEALLRAEKQFAESMAELTAKIADVDIEANQLHRSVQDEVAAAAAELRDAIAMSAKENDDDAAEIKLLLENIETRFDDSIKALRNQIPSIEPLQSGFQKLFQTASESIVAGDAAISKQLAEDIELVRTVIAELSDIQNQIAEAAADKAAVDDANHAAICKSIAEVVEKQEHIVTIKGDKGDKGSEGSPGAGIVTEQWEPGIYREGSIVTYDIGRYAKALRDTVDAPGKSPDWERLGTGGFAWTGVKKDSQAYEAGDFFIDEGTAFIWAGGRANMLCKRGDKGIKGDKGDKGEKGPAGPIGIQGPSIIEIAFSEKSAFAVFSDGSTTEVSVTGLEKYISALVDAKLMSII